MLVSDSEGVTMKTGSMYMYVVVLPLSEISAFPVVLSNAVF